MLVAAETLENGTRDGVSTFASQEAVRQKILHLCMQPDGSFIKDSCRADDLELTCLGQDPTLDFERVHLPLEEKPIQPVNTYDGIVIGGGSHNLHQNLPFFETARSVVRDAIDNAIPTLGIGLGHQLIGQEFGGNIRKSPEIGVVDLTLTLQGKNHPLFLDVPEKFFCHTNHHFMVSNLPNDVTQLARNEDQYQAVEYTPTMWGVQFHPDRSEETMQKIYQGKLPQDRAAEVVTALQNTDLRWRHTMIGNFLAIVRAASQKA